MLRHDHDCGDNISSWPRALESLLGLASLLNRAARELVTSLLFRSNVLSCRLSFTYLFAVTGAVDLLDAWQECGLGEVGRWRSAVGESKLHQIATDSPR